MRAHGVVFVSSAFFRLGEHSAGKFAQTYGACVYSLMLMKAIVQKPVP